MRPRRELAAAPREWIAPGASTALSVLMVWLAPRYEHWFGPALPAFTREYFALYPLWIVISGAALLLAAVGGQIAPLARWRRTWAGADAALTIVSILIIAGGIIALFLPLLIPPEAG